MKTVYIVYRKLSNEEEKFLLNSMKQEECIVYYEKKDFLSDPIRSRQGVQKLPENNHAVHLTNQLHLSRITQLGGTVIGEKTLHEHLKYDLGSYWFYLKFSLFHRTSAIAQEIASIERVKNQYEHSHFVVYSTFPKLADYFKNQVTVFIQKTPQKNRRLGYLFSYALLFITRSLLGFLQLPFRLKRKARNLILTNPYNFQPTLDIDTAEFVQSDPHLGYLIKRTRNDSSFALLSQIRALNLSKPQNLHFSSYFKVNSDTKRTLFFEPFLLLALLSPSFHKRRKQLKHQLALLKKNIAQQPNNDPFIQLSLEVLSVSSKMLFQAILREQASLFLLKLQKIRTVTLIDEHSLKNRSFWIPLKIQGVRIIGVQHGGISNGNIAYRFSDTDKAYHPLPNLTLIRGEYTKQMLQEQSIYSSYELSVVGHMRTDVIPVLNKQNADRHRKPTVLFATQPLPESQTKLKLQQYRDFFTVAGLNPNCLFIIKPHPNEVSHTIYHEIAKEMGVSNYEIKEGNLYYLLSVSDAVVTYFSTVGIEALYFNKELITLDYHELDLQGFIKNGGCHNVKNVVELEQTLQAVLSGKRSISDTQRLAFIEKRSYKIDGQSTERHLSKIMKEHGH